MIRQCEYRIRVSPISLIRKLSRKVERAGKDSCIFFVIEKQPREEEMQPIKKTYFSCFVFSTCKENEVSFRWLINYKSVKDKKILFSGNLLKKSQWGGALRDDAKNGCVAD